jgi:hypothetical protein
MMQLAKSAGPVDCSLQNFLTFKVTFFFRWKSPQTLNAWFCGEIFSGTRAARYLQKKISVARNCDKKRKPN